ncbi:MAG TPA: hypothetical protein DHM42_06115, partial [Clostridiales bacterium]|nr:hypothetical protein [Clostridiales bacterium]
MGNEKQKQVELIGKKKKFFKTLIRYKGDAVEAYMKTYRVQEGTAKKEVLKYMLDNNILQYLIEYATQMNKAGLKQKGKNVTAEEVINTARQVRDICLSTFNFNPSAVLQANEQLGKIGGLFIDITRNEPEDNRKSQIDKKLKELAQDADYSLDTESETDTETD